MSFGTEYRKHIGGPLQWEPLTFVLLRIKCLTGCSPNLTTELHETGKQIELLIVPNDLCSSFLFQIHFLQVIVLVFHLL